jgi:uncharacterized protein (DUF952 family)
MKTIYHIAAKEDLNKAKRAGYYVVESLISEGFIHCSTNEEVVNTANRRFKSIGNLCLLELAEDVIAAPVKYENLQGGAVQYPHIYGKLNLDAIRNIFEFEPNKDGNFTFPGEESNINELISENHFLQLAIKLFQEQKSMCERAMEQLTNQELFYHVNSETNSIAIIVQHLSGNMISRWTDFLTTDGEKAYRERDEEFVTHLSSRNELIQVWEKGWKIFMDTLQSLNASDLLKIIYIRGEAHSVMKAITRQISHYASHTGQIVFIAKQIKGDAWKTLSIARGKSKDFKP